MGPQFAPPSNISHTTRQITIWTFAEAPKAYDKTIASGNACRYTNHLSEFAGLREKDERTIVWPQKSRA